MSLWNISQSKSSQRFGFVALLVALSLSRPSLVASSAGVENPKAHTTNELIYPAQDQLERRTQSITPRIVGGNLADPGEYPWFVSPNGGFYCGGSLVHEDVVLTAAHCDVAFEIGGGLFVGSFVRGSAIEGAQRRTIEQLVQHPYYNEETVANDYMLVKLSEPVTGVTPLRLNSDRNIPVPQTPVTVMGFGLTEPGVKESISLRLNEVNLFTVSHQSCRSAYFRTSPIDELTMLCAGDVAGGRGACQGDSGGPLVMTDTDGEMVQLGIVSFGVGCAEGEYPGVYARISGVYNWIEETICALSENPPSSCTDVNVNESVPTQAPTSADSTGVNDGSQIIKIFFQYDDNPEETYWILSREGRVIYTGPKDHTPQAGQGWKTTFRTFPTGDFGLTVRDRGGNGMRAGTLGKFEVLQESREDGREVLLASGDGNFWHSTSVRFSVRTSLPDGPTTTTAPTIAPTMAPQPTCYCGNDSSDCIESVCEVWTSAAKCESTTGCVFGINPNNSNNNGADNPSQTEDESFIEANLLMLVIAAAALGAILACIMVSVLLFKYYKKRDAKSARNATTQAAPQTTGSNRGNNRNASRATEQPRASGLSSLSYANDSKAIKAVSTAASSGVDADGLAWEDV